VYGVYGVYGVQMCNRVPIYVRRINSHLEHGEGVEWDVRAGPGVGGGGEVIWGEVMRVMR
jgi:hypothetical protein